MTDSVERALGRVEGKLDMVLLGQAAHGAALEEVSKRTSKLERWQSKILGAAAVMGFLGSLVLQAFR